MGFFTALSSNGTLIGPGPMPSLRPATTLGSPDGIGATHDRFRRKEGAFDASLAAVRLCRERGLKVGVRFTMTMDNAHELPRMLDLIAREGVPRFYLSHLNYAGRGDKNRGSDARHQTTRAAMDLLFDACWDKVAKGEESDFVTGNNDADGAYLLFWAARKFPDRLDHLRAKLEQWGGNASGVNVANIDNLGNVHPDTFWWHHNLGNVRDRPFSAIWQDVSDPLMAGLKARPRASSCGSMPSFRHLRRQHAGPRIETDQ